MVTNLGDDFQVSLQSMRKEQMMARSVRHTPLVPRTTTESEKKDKQLAHHRERKWVHDHLNPQIAGAEDFDIVAFREHPRAGRDAFGKDGKLFVGSRAKYDDAPLMRK
jgi:hypothetical protein